MVSARPNKRAATALVQKTTREDIEKHAHLPVDQAAAALGIGRTTFKKVCRQVGIMTWGASTING
jgi:hypothetical protein